MMNRKVAIRWAASAVLILASGSLLAASQSNQQTAGAAAQQSTTVSDTRAPATATTVTVGGLTNNTGAYRGPQSRVSALTIAECEGLGGKVVDVADKSCPWTGKVCYTADKDGVIHHSCITMAP